jgi:Domain of unknown function (DUF1929)/Bacterial Ig-like domain (group 2)
MLKHLLSLSLVMLVACTDGTTVIDPPKPPGPGVDNSAKVDSISLFAHRGILSPGESSELRIITKDAAGTILEPTPKLTWTSSKPAVASINADRTVQAKAAGQTSITVSVNGKTSNSIVLEVQSIDAAYSIGRWSSVIDWPVTVAHASIMPNGTLVTFPWRKTSPWGEPNSTISGYAAGGMTGQPKTMIDTWNPSTDTHSSTWETKTDMFGAGHDLLEDGRLFVSGGSATGPDWYGIKDNHVLKAGVWSSVSSMSLPRWYPSVTTLGSGEVLVSGGVTALDAGGGYITTNVNELWNPQANTWRTLTGAVNVGVPLYPRMQVSPDGTVVMTGPATTLSRLNTTGNGAWTNLGIRDNINRVYGASVLFDEGKVLEVGGSNPQDPTIELQVATNTAKVIDLRTGAATATGSMQFGRRNLNATVLPNQTVLVTGGNTVGNGNAGEQVLNIPQRFQTESELWDQNTGTFRVLASESIGRPYHSVALLLPDARVFSAGGYDSVPFPNTDPNYRPKYKNAQIFTPPYLFTTDGQLATRPEILEAPSKLGYDQALTVRVSQPDQISKACLIRLGSVTHAFNFGQRYVKLEVQNVAGKLEMRSPSNANLAPPGFYYLFVLDQNGVPSIAKTVRLTNEP